MKKFFIVLCLSLLTVSSIYGQKRNTFAIITDSVSYDKCNTEINNYAESVKKSGLRTLIIPGTWTTPEQVRDTLVYLYSDCGLQGTVFIGDIPIPMIRKAQHLTSAFKMDEKFPMRESSVPSDRFYDDFDLSFRFIARDSAQSNLFYYEMAPDSPQYIDCDIYSARIKPSSKYGDRYEELSAYLKKLVKIRAENNKLDQITSFTGHGSFSNSLAAWKDETITLKEQMPDAYAGKNEARFYVFAMDDYMKEQMIQEIKREDLDMVLFHEHGMTERQYLTGYPYSKSMDDYYEMGKFYARCMLRSSVRYGSTEEEAMQKFEEKYHVDPSWYEGAFDPEVMAADSIFDLKTGIIVEEIQEIAPNVRFAIFDACYNGDFREEDWIGGRYIFSDGKCVVTTGNSVNVLQDKSSSDLMGMLAAGYSIGEWMQQINILESHVFGDPTFRFTSSYDFERPDLYETDTKYWLQFLNDGYPCDIQSLALHKLYKLNYEDMQELLLRTYRTSPYYMERLQCMHLLVHYDTEAYQALLTEAVDDPYEYIRRKAVTYIGRVGSDNLLPVLVNTYINDTDSKRVAFDVAFSAGLFPNSAFVDVMNKAIEDSDFIFDKKLFAEKAEEIYGNGIRMGESTLKKLTSPELKEADESIYMSGIKNNPYPYMADILLEIIKSPEYKLSLRCQAAETLGWYVRAWNKKMICGRLEEYLDSGSEIPAELSDEIIRTTNILKSFLK